MNLAEFLAENGTMLAAEVKVIEHEGVTWLKFIGIIPDAMPVTPVQLLSRAAMFPDHPKKNLANFYSPCDAVACINGKFVLQNGEEYKCYRCNGMGYITIDKQVANKKFDITDLGQSKLANGDTVLFE